MGKIVGITEFKAKCIALLHEMERSGEPLTITRRGKPDLTLNAQSAELPKPLQSARGMLKSDRYRFEDPFNPAVDPDEWEANNPAGLYRRA